ncbi:TIGR01906 family membrane protein [Aerococcus urinae]
MAKNIRFYLGLTSLVLFILAGAITFTIWFTPLYYLIAYLEQVNQVVDLSWLEIFQDYHRIIAYLNFPWIESLSLIHFPMSDQGSFHFYEVKRLFQILYILLLTSGLLSARLLKKLKNNQAYFYLYRPMKGLMVLPLLLIPLFLIFFDQVFVLFHQVLFNNDAWLFDPKFDPVIEILPETFFLACFILVVVLIECAFYYFYRLGKTSLEK